MARPKNSKQRRRGRHEGSVRKTRSGTWEASISLGIGPNGKRKRLYANAPTKHEALAKLAELRQQPFASRSGKVTVAGYVDTWLEYKRRSVQPPSYRRYTNRAGYAKRYLGNYLLADLQVSHIHDWYRQMTKDGVTLHTQADAGKLFSRVLHQAQKEKLVSDNPAADCPYPRPPKSKITILSRDDVARLLEETSTHRLAALLVASVGTGARIGELLALEWTDIDFDEQTIRFEKTTTQEHRPISAKESKTPGSQRTLPLSSSVAEALREHRQKLIAEGLETCPLVFPTRNGTYLQRNSVSSGVLLPALKRAGLPKIHIHDLRHTAATLMLQRTDAKTVSRILGHASVTFTLNTYVQPTPESEKAAISFLDDLLDKKKSL